MLVMFARELNHWASSSAYVGDTSRQLYAACDRVRHAAESVDGVVRWFDQFGGISRG